MSQIQLTLTRASKVKWITKHCCLEAALQTVGHQLDEAKVLQAAEFSASAKTILYPCEVTAL